jgi:surface antigen
MISQASQRSGRRAGVTPCLNVPGWRGVQMAVTLATLAMAGVASGGCSMSYQLGSLFGKNDEKTAEADRTDITGSTRAAPALGAGGKISAADLAAARQAAADLMAAGGKDTSSPWENPDTGARGTVTPITAAYTQDGFTCRDFLASVVRDRAETWLQGEACRVHKGKWEVRAMKPWKRA